MLEDRETLSVIVQGVSLVLPESISSNLVTSYPKRWEVMVMEEVIFLKTHFHVYLHTLLNF